MHIENIKIGSTILIKLKTGAVVIGVVGAKNIFELRDGKVAILRVILAENCVLDIAEDEIELIKDYGLNEQDEKHLYLPEIFQELKKYGIEEDLTVSELINFFLYTWDNSSYTEEDKKKICTQLLYIVDSDILKEFLNLLADSNRKVKKYHVKNKKHLKEKYESLIYELDKEYDSWGEGSLLLEIKE